MAKIKINADKCIHCFQCVLVCPLTVIEKKDGKAVPNNDRRCMECGHCAAACPKEAISIGENTGLYAEALPTLPESFPKDLENHLRMRRSYRRFQQMPVDREIIAHALQVAGWAPSAKNEHPAKWIVIDDAERLQQMMDIILDYIKETGAVPEILEEYNRGNNMVMGNARTVILAYGSEKAINPPADTAMALYTAELVLQTKGIGTCWTGYLMRLCNTVPALKEMFRLPEGYRFYGGLMVGYLDRERYTRVPQRLPQAEICWI